MVALHFIATHPAAERMVFIGGTNLRVIKGLPRFSEDLDFDLRGMRREEFVSFTDDLIRHLRLLGWPVEPKARESDRLTAYRRSLYFPELLYDLGLSPYREARFMMKLEGQDQGVGYPLEYKLVRKYGFTFRVLTPPDGVLLAMKFIALLNRTKGRDLFDIVFLLSLGVEPEMNFIHKKHPEISSKEDLYRRTLSLLAEVDLTDKEKDVAHLLIRSEDTKQIRLLPEVLRAELEAMQVEGLIGEG